MLCNYSECEYVNMFEINKQIYAFTSAHTSAASYCDY